MFVYNVKINSIKSFKTIFIIFILIVLIIAIIASIKVFSRANLIGNLTSEENTIHTIENENYPNILKAVNENIEDYIGTKFTYTGYVYKLIDFDDNQFVLARDMVFASDYRSLVVGFLCEYDNAKELTDSSWVTITGEITRGLYHDKEIPIIKILDLKEVEKPNDQYVYPPSDTYIPTAGILY